MEKIAPWRILAGLVCLLTLLQAGAAPTSGRGAGTTGCAAGKRPISMGLLAVSAITASAAWAVGQRQYTPYCTTPVIERWDGRHWSIAPLPQSDALAAGWLWGVAATAPDDAWAVGTGFLHWDGVRWRNVPNPPLGGVVAIAAASRTDVWAAGAAQPRTAGSRAATGAGPRNAGQEISARPAAREVAQHAVPGAPFRGHPALAHWDGRSWHAVPTPALALIGEFTAVATTSAGDVWAAGWQDATATGGSREEGLVEHWDGRHWHILPGLDWLIRLSSVAATSAADAWVVGINGPVQDGSHTLAHWDGRRWGGGNVLEFVSAVAAITPRDAWAVGIGIEHWDGRTWREVTIPGIARQDLDLAAVSAASSSDVWAVGGIGRYRFAHWDGHTWRVVPSP